MPSAASATAQGYPTKPIRLIVPFAPGGTTDIIARVIAEKVPSYLGQRVVVDNRSGKGGLIGAEMLARAPADGYTLGVATVSTIATGPAMDPKISYNPTVDFTPIINIAATPNVLVVHPSFPAGDYKAFIAELRMRPDHYSYASSGEGGLGHMLMALFQSKTGTSLLHVPYSGGGPALNSVVGGHVPLMIANLPTARPHIEAKRLVPIAVAGYEADSKLLKVPTFEQLGVPEVNRLAFYGICGPRRLPGRIVDAWHGAVKRTLADPQVADVIAKTGSSIIANTPDAFREQIKTEFETYKRVVEGQKLKQ
jgi:tripartite-type tricarboxylate transporter receptor subunit TctC